MADTLQRGDSGSDSDQFMELIYEFIQIKNIDREGLGSDDQNDLSLSSVQTSDLSEYESDVDPPPSDDDAFSENERTDDVDIDDFITQTAQLIPSRLWLSPIDYFY